MGFIQKNINNNMFNSKEYWENRYKQNGTSGAGSYGLLAVFKKDVVNDFIESNNIVTVGDFGCGDANQLKLFNCDKYVGYDVSETVINKCRSEFKYDESKSFYLISEYNSEKYDLTLSLDIIYHLVEDDVFEDYMNRLFYSSKKYVIIYSSNGETDIKTSIHVRDRNFTTWVENNIENFELINKIENRYKFDINNQITTSISNFYFYKRFL